jgi:hypothetical protein
MLESVVGFRMMEDLFERSIFKCCTIDISCYPIIVEYRCALLVSMSLKTSLVDLWEGDEVEQSFPVGLCLPARSLALTSSTLAR